MNEVRGRAMHAGKVLCVQSSLVKDKSRKEAWLMFTVQIVLHQGLPVLLRSDPRVKVD